MVKEELSSLFVSSNQYRPCYYNLFYRYQDKNTSAMIMRSAAGNWLALRGELLSNFLVTSVSAGALFATQSRGEWRFYELFCLSSREVERK